MPSLLKHLDVTCVSLVDRAAVRDHSNPTEPQRLLLWKRDDTDPKGGTMTEAEMKTAVEKAEQERDALKKTADETAAKLTKAETERAELAARVEKLEKASKKPKTDDDEMDLAKADLPEPVRRALLKAQEAEKVAKAELEKIAKRADDAEALAKAERDARVTREFVAKAETYKSLPIEAEKFGPILKSASEKLTKEEAAELDRVLKAADEQIRVSDLFKEQGRGGQPPAADSAVAEMQRKAEELKKSDPKLSDAEALDKAMSSDRQLQQRYLDEVRG